MSGTDASDQKPNQLVCDRIVRDVTNALSKGQKRLIALAPPATGKTTAAIRIAFGHLLREPKMRDGQQSKILYIGSNPIVVQQQCEQLASVVPSGSSDWNFAIDGIESRIIGITWRQLVHIDLDPSKFSLVIADDAHHGASPVASNVLNSFQSPVIGFSNSIRHPSDTASFERRGSNIVLKIGSSTLKDFFGAPVTNISYADLTEMGISLNVPIRSIAGSGPIRSDTDPRIKAIVDEFSALIAENGQCKTLIHVDSIEEAELLKDLLTSALRKDESGNGTSRLTARTYHSEVEPIRKARIAYDFDTGKLPILINCQAFDEGHVIKDLGLVVIAGKMRTPNVYERTIGRILHSEVDGRKVLDLFANPANFSDRPQYPSKSFGVLKNKPEIQSTDISSVELIFGSSELDPNAINTDEKIISPLWTRETAAEAIASLHYHGIGSPDRLPTRTQIDLGAQQGLCPPSWLVFTDHDNPGFFNDSEELAREIGRHANQYMRSKLTKSEVLKLVKAEWEKDAAPDGLFSKHWLESKCDGITLPFRLRTIVGNDTFFSNFDELRKAMRLQGKYFRSPSKNEALAKIRELYKGHNGNPAIAKPGRKISTTMIQKGSKENICPSAFNLFELGYGNIPVFPGGIDEVNRLLGIKIFKDMTKEEVLQDVQNLDVKYWPDRRFPISQQELIKANADGALAFTSRHIIGKGKFWGAKDSFDQELGYRETPFHYRSLRHQIRSGKLDSI